MGWGEGLPHIQTYAGAFGDGIAHVFVVTSDGVGDA